MASKRSIYEDLAYLYELDEFKSFKKFCEAKRDKISKQVLNIDMSEIGAPQQVAMLQGQHYALQYLLLEIKKIHKERQTKT